MPNMARLRGVDTSLINWVGGWVILNELIFNLISTMNIRVLSAEQGGEKQRQREAAFYNFIYHRMVGPTAHSPIHYGRFLETEFTSFPVARGYPIIARDCRSPQCYFYVSDEEVEHSFLRFLNGELLSLRCQCGNSMRKAEEFVYDSALAGFLQLKLTDAQLSTLRAIQITRNHEVYLDSKGPFYESFNKARLTALSAFATDLTRRQEKGESEVREGRTLKVDTQCIMQEIEERMGSCAELVGRGKPGELVREEDKLTAVLPCFVAKETKGTAYIYKQRREEQKFCSVPLMVSHKLEEKLLEYYDFGECTYYWLSRRGDLFKCDLRSMYHFLANSYLLTKLCSLPLPSALHPDYSALLVRKQTLYLFCGEQGQQFVALLKGELPSQPTEQQLPLRPILENKLRNRKGYSVAWVKASTLIQDECIIVFGGVVERVRNFKLLEIVGLSHPEEKYLLHKVNIREEEFEGLSYCHPAIAIFAGRLVVLGGVEKHKTNRSIGLVPLREGSEKTEVRQLFSEEKKEETIERVPGALHVGEGWMIVASRSNKRIYPIINRLRKVQGGDIEIDQIK